MKKKQMDSILNVFDCFSNQIGKDGASTLIDFMDHTVTFELYHKNHPHEYFDQLKENISNERKILYDKLGKEKVDAISQGLELYISSMV